ncbi:hypothetical protein J3E72DRAFT_298637 [Bipolaris maydis]|uniref:uncharacterized protein n=1 Tax=Cochliobolus heterostrophus TaxID=5016 RepID=UPI0024D6ECFF|nr:hypothetical protein J3E73DRAFT_277026 [Bipolaris maydis]KAJ5065476.1 hypothetical protein J3E74DRAFT_302273 [Bipolaris maydis]KAJ6200687.1 hypothetical protein J3E72DRAFT_298637 [Bipolaris maydis]KAJ6213469.1 hypothetical protein PSV09DRAFT_2277261 [Bipolaris maydis]KAJ6274692.1 hypothetical protein PSV08DRAFT_266611 [Bipolaris maydis]
MHISLFFRLYPLFSFLRSYLCVYVYVCATNTVSLLHTYVWGISIRPGVGWPEEQPPRHVQPTHDHRWINFGGPGGTCGKLGGGRLLIVVLGAVWRFCLGVFFQKTKITGKTQNVQEETDSSILSTDKCK